LHQKLVLEKEKKELEKEREVGRRSTVPFLCYLESCLRALIKEDSSVYCIS
jgi:hypothetical protein